MWKLRKKFQTFREREHDDDFACGLSNFRSAEAEAKLQPDGLFAVVSAFIEVALKADICARIGGETNGGSDTVPRPGGNVQSGDAVDAVDAGEGTQVGGCLIGEERAQAPAAGFEVIIVMTVVVIVPVVVVVVVMTVVVVVSVCLAGEANDFGAPGEIATAGFEAVFAPQVLDAREGEPGFTAFFVVAHTAGKGKGPGMKVVALPAGAQSEGEEIVLETQFFEVTVISVVSVIIVVVMMIVVAVSVVIMPMVMVMFRGTAEAEGQHGGPGGIEVEVDFTADGLQAFITEEERMGQRHIDGFPSVEVDGVVETDAIEEATAAEFDAAGEVVEFQEGFLPFPFEIVMVVGKKGTGGEGGNVVAPAEGEAGFEGLQLECAIPVGVMGARGKVLRVVSTAAADDGIDMQGGGDGKIVFGLRRRQEGGHGQGE